MRTVAILALSAVLGLCTAASAQAPLKRTDIMVPIVSTAPGMAGQTAQLYVRQVRGSGAARGVVLFVHGAGTPAEVSFDAPGASWMAYLAQAGFDTFSMDMEGYGRSTRPPQMDDPCNAPQTTRDQIGGEPKACTPYPGPITTMASDWNDIAAVVDALLARTGAKKLSIIAWSQGGPRSFGYTAAHPDKVERLAVLAPAYNRNMPDALPEQMAPNFTPFGTQTREEFIANWNRQAPCPGQYDPAIRDAIWKDMLASDPVGATWGNGMRRAPSVPSFGFNKVAAAKFKTPYLMIAGATDGQVAPQRVRELYEDLGSSEKVLVDMACASHAAMWEKDRVSLYKASLDWLTTGRVGGVSRGVVKLGY